MATLFGRKKSRPRQSSVSGELNEHSTPYDKLEPASRAPVPVGTISQGLRTSVASNNISAPITNPTLTNDGTELNVYAMQRSRSERERLYPQSKTLGRSPYMSPSTSSTTLYSDPPSSTSTNVTTVTNSSRLRRSEASSSGRQSPSMVDFGGYSPTSPAPPSSYNMGNSTIRPTSVTSARTESNRGSKYAPSLSPSESLQSHYSHASQLFHSKHGTQEGFDFPRPSDEEVDALFHRVMMARNISDVPDMSTDQKWQIVYNDEQLRWKDEKKLEDATKKHMETRQTPAAASYARDSPEWYLQKVLDLTITQRQAASLLVSLRTGTMRYYFISQTTSLICLMICSPSWYTTFLESQGASALANALHTIARKGEKRFVVP